MQAEPEDAAPGGLASLPADALRHIASLLPLQEALALESCCRSLRQLRAPLASAIALDVASAAHGAWLRDNVQRCMHLLVAEAGSAAPDAAEEALHCILRGGRALCTLHVRSMPRLTALPRSFSLQALTSLALCTLPALLRLPDELGEQLVALESLRISSCVRLEGLPESLGQLRQLRLLVVTQCAVRSLPESLCALTALQHLSLNELWALQALPSSVAGLDSLVSLQVHYCSVAELPPGLAQLPRLQQISVRGCPAAVPNGLHNSSPPSALRLDWQAWLAVSAKVPGTGVPSLGTLWV